MALNGAILSVLTGVDVDCYSVFEGSVRSLEDLHANARSTNHVELIYAYHV